MFNSNDIVQGFAKFLPRSAAKMIRTHNSPSSESAPV